MKLKKIASLMLAGIMAVSMLAGCKGNETNADDDKDEVVTPVATDVAKGANNVINGYAKTVLGLSYTDDTALAKALEEAAGSVYKSTDVEAINAYSEDADVTNSGKGADVAAKITKSLTGTSNSLDWTNGYFALNAEETNKALWICTVGGAFGADDVGAFVGDYMNSVMSSTHMPASDTTYNATYDADIAAVKVTSKEDSTKTAWVVAVVITQNVSEI